MRHWPRRPRTCAGASPAAWSPSDPRHGRGPPMSDLDDRPGSSGSVTDGLRLALGTLTVFRTRGPWVVDRASAGLAMMVAPVVGLLLALPVTVLVWLLGYGPSGDRTYLWRLVSDL